MDEISQNIIELVTNHYLNSGDFNGTHFMQLVQNIGIEWEELLPKLISLITDGYIQIIDENSDVNPHIIRRGFEQVDVQIAKLEKGISLHTCLYPSSSHLINIVDEDLFRATDNI